MDIILANQELFNESKNILIFIRINNNENIVYMLWTKIRTLSK